MCSEGGATNSGVQSKFIFHQYVMQSLARLHYRYYSEAFEIDSTGTPPSCNVRTINIFNLPWQQTHKIFFPFRNKMLMNFTSNLQSSLRAYIITNTKIWYLAAYADNKIYEILDYWEEVEGQLMNSVTSNFYQSS